MAGILVSYDAEQYFLQSIYSVIFVQLWVIANGGIIK